MASTKFPTFLLSFPLLNRKFSLSITFLICITFFFVLAGRLARVNVSFFIQSLHPGYIVFSGRSQEKESFDCKSSSSCLSLSFFSENVKCQAFCECVVRIWASVSFFNRVSNHIPTFSPIFSCSWPGSLGSRGINPLRIHFPQCRLEMQLSPVSTSVNTRSVSQLPKYGCSFFLCSYVSMSKNIFTLILMERGKGPKSFCVLNLLFLSCLFQFNIIIYSVFFCEPKYLPQC